MRLDITFKNRCGGMRVDTFSKTFEISDMGFKISET